MKISAFTFVKIDNESGIKTYRLFDNRLVLVFNAMDWLISFWLKPAHKEPSYARGGLGFWKINIETDWFTFRLGK